MIRLFPTTRALLGEWRTTALVVLSVALAVAVGSTAVSLLEALIYPKLDMAAPDRLYWVNFYGGRENRLPASKRDSIMSLHAKAFESTTWERIGSQILLENGERFVAVAGVRAGPRFFEVAGITPAQGRILTAKDTNASPAVILLSQRTAAQLFGDDSAVGKTIRYRRAARLVVGVLGDQADFPSVHTGVWTIGEDSPDAQRLIRIRDGFTRHNVEAALDTASFTIAALVKQRARMDVAFRLRPAVQTQFRYQNFHFAIGAACIALLLIACANAASLELSRAIGKRRQLAIRSALGASPLALIRDALKEEAVLAGIATVVALAMTAVAARALYAVVPPSVGEFVIHPHVGWRVVTFSILAAGLATLLVGSAPAIWSARVDPQETLKESAGTGRSHRRYYATLVALELGLAIALTCGAIVMVRATAAFDAKPLGYDPSRVVGGSIVDRRSSSARGAMEALRHRLDSVPGVASSAVTLIAQVRNNRFTVEDSSGGPREIPAPLVRFLMVTPGYFRTLGVSIASGRDFDPAIVNEPQVILDERSAARLWPGSDPVGQRLKLGGSTSNAPFARVVGLVAGLPDSSQGSTFGPPPPEHAHVGIFYLPVPDDPLTATRYAFRRYEFVASATRNAPALVMSLRRALISVENAEFASVQLMDEALGTSRARASRRFLMQLFVFFALCGIVLSGVGVFSILAQSVTERWRELSVRRALGASTLQVLRAVLRETGPIVLLGIALGLLLTKYAIPMLGSQALFDDRFNALLFAFTSAVVVAVLGGFVAAPVLRAIRVPTSEALRSL